MNIRSVLSIVLISVAALWVISSCATITEKPEGGASFSLGKKEPSARREFKLLNMDISLAGSPSAEVEYRATINFEADPKPAISRACFNFSGKGQSCVDLQAKDISYGSQSYFRVPIHVPEGSKKIDCYAEYIRDGKTHRTNTVTYHVIVLKKPDE